MLFWWLSCVAEVPEPPPVEVAPKPAPKRKARSGKPKPKPCLSGPGEVEGDEDMAASTGLDAAQVSAAVKPVYPAVAQCAADGAASPTSELRLAVTVSCGGVVDRVSVLDAGDWPEPVVACAIGALERLPFPAHGLPDGDRFELPLRFH